ncbi:hypothetical protein CSUB01_05313 [Colletotrichum sublineola]|uniref:Tyrosinase C-terminal domain-containing protein n=1 Tax=Colletotrichum sublineola TaxID=1173701 RepID=A0A066XHV4_COLSU|nr:hypothetical protein CSUB01_05313 [Colletotrichum sublineola]
MSQDIVLTIPGDAVGKTKQKRLDHNPLYSYKFTSDYATDQMRSIMKQWPHTDKWRKSKRCPDVDGNSHPKIADKEVGQFTEFKTKTFRANAPEGTPEKMKVHVTQQIYKLYSTPALGGIPSNKPLKKVRPPTKGHDLPVGATPPDDILGRTPKSWQAFLRVRNFALTGTWAVHFLFGELPADSGEWLLSPSRVGTVTMLSSTAREGCAPTASGRRRTAST